ncbi:MAG TPA: heparinase II/III family protein [Planctomycetota bacterium]|nr:heparinase II/III family protein [Planctomycetota bacterium]
MKTISGLALVLALAAPAAAGELQPAPAPKPVELIPPAAGIAKDHPRLLLRAKDSPQAVSVEQLRKIPRDAEFSAMLEQLRKCGGAAPAALVWQLTGEKADAEKALAALRAWKAPEKAGDPFDIYFPCRDAALAYDWLHGYPGFTDEIKKEVRDKVFPLAAIGLKNGHDHVFHNYVWMWNCGAALWALASAGDDPRGDKLLTDVATRFNADMFPAMAYLQGQPADSPGYWSLYCLAPGATVLAAAQSAFGQDLAGKVAKDGGDWVGGQLENLAHQTLPNLRHMPWGDQQEGGDGGVAHEMAGTIDMMTWLSKSPAGAHLGRRIAGLRGTKRFYGETAMFYFIYTRTMAVEAKEPPLARLSGGAIGGNWMAREKWDDGATVVALRCTDCYTGHNHFDEGSFVIYRQGLLAADAGIYKNVGGAQQKTNCHNTLLFGGAGQRGVRPSSNATLEGYIKALQGGGKGFETGNMLFQEDKGAWAAAAGEFGQAYDPAVVGRAMRQVLFLRPGTIAIVDQLAAPQGKDLPEVTWPLHVTGQPKVDGAGVSAGNGKAWLRCRALLPAGAAAPAVSDGPLTYLEGGNKKAPTWRAEYKYPGKASLTLVHLLEVGDGAEPGAAADAKAEATVEGVALTIAGRKFLFAVAAPCAVIEGK